jgi:hypothetical protein
MLFSASGGGGASLNLEIDETLLGVCFGGCLGEIGDFPFFPLEDGNFMWVFF